MPSPALPLPVWLTALSAVLLAVLLALMLRAPETGDRLSQLHYPGESAGRMVERHLDFYEGYERIGAWERALHAILFGSRTHVEDQAVQVYREVLLHFETHPEDATPWAVLNTRARLLVTLAETRRAAELAEEMAGTAPSLEEEVIREAILFAYGEDAATVPTPAVLYGANLLPLGWASDRLRLRIAEKAGQARSQQLAEQRLHGRGERGRERVLMMAGVVTVALGVGLLVLVRWRSLASPAPWPPGVLASPWRLGDGLGVLICAGLLGLLVSMLLGLLAQHYLRPGLLTLWTTLFASLPMLWLMQRYLLRPRGLTLRSAFGLSLRGVGVLHFARLTLAVLALEWAGTVLIAWVAWQLGAEPHWSQGLYEMMIFGPWETTLLGGINTVVWAPLFEEIGFRGLLYVTLRSRLGPLAAAVISAGLFSALHMYSLAGLLAVFWSGLVFAFAFERFRSLLPGIAVHGVGNLLALLTVLLFYR